MKQYPTLAITISILTGIVAGVLDLIMGYAPIPHIIILVGAIVFSMFNTKQSWIIALALGGSIPIAHGIAKVLGTTPSYELDSAIGILRPIVLAFAGSMIGVRTSANWMKSPNNSNTEEEQE